MLHVHRAERTDRLVEGLCELLGAPLPDAFAEEVIAVHTRGMERWLAQRLSTRLGAGDGRSDGICANVAFPSPGRLVRDAVATASGIFAEEDPWLPERLVWRLLPVIDEHLDEEWLRPLASYIRGPAGSADPPREGRRFPAARHLAGLFDRYAVLRPEMVEAWRQGEDTDGEGEPLPEHSAWQAELWRKVAGGIPVPGPAQRIGSACERLRAEREIVELPQRFSLFGITRLPAGHGQVLEALASDRDVHVFVLHPSAVLWENVAESTKGQARILSRSEDATASLPANPLLRSWGKDARELQLVLSSLGDFADRHLPGDSEASCLLSRIQADVWSDQGPPGPPVSGKKDLRADLDNADPSIRVHACHGRARQVEVLREAILHALDEDPTLEPRDVIVMCPDIETFAPLIQATFGGAESKGEEGLEETAEASRAPALRVKLADRALRQTNPVLGVVARLLELAAGRVTASQVLDLADREPVRRRFQLDDDDLGQLESWVSSTGIHWGLDAPHRRAFQLEAVSAGTWQAGLDRILLGVAMSEEELRLFGRVLPLDDVPSGAIGLAGRFAELIERLQISLDQLSGSQPVGAWVTAIADAADALTATVPWEEWQRAELGRILDEVAAEASLEGEPSGSEVTLAEVRGLLAERLQGRPTWTNFRTGHLTICTLMPMRSVPHRVVCLLGLDDGVFPRHSGRDGDDLTLDDPRIGERDPRAEDRQLLLDALLSASERLIITYTGNDERTNIPQPPAVPVGELLDVIENTVRCEGGSARDVVLVRHPLQPFDPRNFIPGALRTEKPWGFERVDLEGAVALSSERQSADEFLEGPLSQVHSRVVELDDLVRFVQHPVRALLRQRLGISLFRPEDEIVDDLPIALDGLAEWGIGQRMLEAQLTGVSKEAAMEAELCRGELPPGELGRRVLSRISDNVEQLVAETKTLPSVPGEPESLDVRLTLPDGSLLSGTVPGVRGEVLRSATYSRVSPQQRLAAWVRFLASCAAYPVRPFESYVIGRVRSGRPERFKVTVARIPPLDTEAETRRQLALAHLAVLLDIYGRGVCEPLPIACRASAAYARARGEGKDAEKAARGAWESSFKFDKEDREEEHRLVWGGVRPFDLFLRDTPRPDETGDDWDASESTRFGRYAVRLWAGLLDREVLEER